MECRPRDEQGEEERSTERVKTPILAALGASTAEPIGVVYETSYLNITLFLLIINLDYSRHLKRAMTPQKKKEKGEERFYTINTERSQPHLYLKMSKEHNFRFAHNKCLSVRRHKQTASIYS